MNSVKLFYIFESKKDGMLLQFTRSIQLKDDARTEIFFEPDHEVIEIRLEGQLKYQLSLKSVQLKFSEGNEHLSIERFFEILNFTSDRFSGFSHVNIYRDVNGDFLNLQVYGYQSNFGSGLFLNVNKFP